MWEDRWAPALGLFNGWSCVWFWECLPFLVQHSSPHFWKHRLVSCGKHTVYNVSGLVPSAISHTRALMEDGGEGIQCPALLISCFLQSGTLKFQSATLKPTPLARLLGSSQDLLVSLLQHWADRHRGQGFELRSSFVHSKMLLSIDSVPNSSSPFYLLPYSLRRNWIDALGLTSQRVCPAGHSDGGTGAK